MIGHKKRVMAHGRQQKGQNKSQPTGKEISHLNVSTSEEKVADEISGDNPGAISSDENVIAIATSEDVSQLAISGEIPGKTFDNNIVGGMVENVQSGDSHVKQEPGAVQEAVQQLGHQESGQGKSMDETWTSSPVGCRAGHAVAGSSQQTTPVRKKKPKKFGEEFVLVTVERASLVQHGHHECVLCLPGQHFPARNLLAHMRSLQHLNNLLEISSAAAYAEHGSCGDAAVIYDLLTKLLANAPPQKVHVVRPTDADRTRNALLQNINEKRRQMREEVAASKCVPAGKIKISRNEEQIQTPSASKQRVVQAGKARVLCQSSAVAATLGHGDTTTRDAAAGQSIAVVNSVDGTVRQPVVDPPITAKDKADSVCNRDFGTDATTTTTTAADVTAMSVDATVDVKVTLVEGNSCVKPDVDATLTGDKGATNAASRSEVASIPCIIKVEPDMDSDTMSNRAAARDDKIVSSNTKREASNINVASSIVKANRTTTETISSTKASIKTEESSMEADKSGECDDNNAEADRFDRFSSKLNKSGKSDVNRASRDGRSVQASRTKAKSGAVLVEKTFEEATAPNKKRGNSRENISVNKISSESNAGNNSSIQNIPVRSGNGMKSTEKNHKITTLEKSGEPRSGEKTVKSVNQISKSGRLQTSFASLLGRLRSSPNSSNDAEKQVKTSITSDGDSSKTLSTNMDSSTTRSNLFTRESRFGSSENGDTSSGGFNKPPFKKHATDSDGPALLKLNGGPAGKGISDDSCSKNVNVLLDEGLASRLEETILAAINDDTYNDVTEYLGNDQMEEISQSPESTAMAIRDESPTYPPFTLFQHIVIVGDCGILRHATQWDSGIITFASFEVDTLELKLAELAELQGNLPYRTLWIFMADTSIVCTKNPAPRIAQKTSKDGSVINLPHCMVRKHISLTGKNDLKNMVSHRTEIFLSCMKIFEETLPREACIVWAPILPFRVMFTGWHDPEVLHELYVENPDVIFITAEADEFRNSFRLYENDVKKFVSQSHPPPEKIADFIVRFYDSNKPVVRVSETAKAVAKSFDRTGEWLALVTQIVNTGLGLTNVGALKFIEESARQRLRQTMDEGGTETETGQTSLADYGLPVEFAVPRSQLNFFSVSVAQPIISNKDISFNNKQSESCENIYDENVICKTNNTGLSVSGRISTLDLLRYSHGKPNGLHTKPTKVDGSEKTASFLDAKPSPVTKIVTDDVPTKPSMSFVATNIPSVATNAPAVAGSAPFVATNAPSVARNAPSIATNAPSIAKNASSIASNVQSVTRNAQSVTTNAPSVVTNASSIFKNASYVATTPVAPALVSAVASDAMLALTSNAATASASVAATDVTSDAASGTWLRTMGDVRHETETDPLANTKGITVKEEVEEGDDSTSFSWAGSGRVSDYPTVDLCNGIPVFTSNIPKHVGLFLMKRVFAICGKVLDYRLETHKSQMYLIAATTYSTRQEACYAVRLFEVLTIGKLRLRVWSPNVERIDDLWSIEELRMKNKVTQILAVTKQVHWGNRPMADEVKKAPEVIVIDEKSDGSPCNKLNGRRQSDSPSRKRRSSRSGSPDKKKIRTSARRSSNNSYQRNSKTKSPIRLKRSKSPVRLRRSKSPVRLRRSKSPVRLRRSKSPVRLRRSKSPVRLRRSKSPVGLRRSRSPVRLRRSKSPVRLRRSKSPVRLRRSKSPVRFRRSKSPIRKRRSKSPIRLRRRTPPSRTRRSKSPNRRRRSKSPIQLKRSRSPLRRRSKSRSPLRGRMTRSSSQHKRSRAPSSPSSASKPSYGDHLNRTTEPSRNVNSHPDILPSSNDHYYVLLKSPNKNLPRSFALIVYSIFSQKGLDMYTSDITSTKNGWQFSLNCRQASLYLPKMNGLRLLDTVLQAQLLRRTDKPADEDSSTSNEQQIDRLLELGCEEYNRHVLLLIKEDQEKVVDVYSYKIERCGADKCSRYDCHKFHSSEEQRRDLRTCHYRAEMCVTLKDKGSCPAGHLCQYCHTTNDLRYHPDVFQRNVCSSTTELVGSYCHRGHACVDAHVGTPDMLFMSSWQNLYVSGLENSFKFLLGAVRKLHRKKKVPDHSVRILFVTASAGVADRAFQLTAPLAQRHHLQLAALNSLKGGEVAVGTAKQLSEQPVDGQVCRHLVALVLDDLNALFAREHAPTFRKLIEKIFAGKHQPDHRVNIVATFSKSGPEELVRAEKLFGTSFRVINPSIDVKMGSSLGVKERVASTTVTPSQPAAFAAPTVAYPAITSLAGPNASYENTARSTDLNPSNSQNSTPEKINLVDLNASKITSEILKILDVAKVKASHDEAKILNVVKVKASHDEAKILDVAKVKASHDEAKIAYDAYATTLNNESFCKTSIGSSIVPPEIVLKGSTVKASGDGGSGQYCPFNAQTDERATEQHQTNNPSILTDAGRYSNGDTDYRFEKPTTSAITGTITSVPSTVGSTINIARAINVVAGSDVYAGSTATNSSLLNFKSYPSSNSSSLSRSLTTLIPEAFDASAPMPDDGQSRQILLHKLDAEKYLLNQELDAKYSQVLISGPANHSSYGNLLLKEIAERGEATISKNCWLQHVESLKHIEYKKRLMELVSKYKSMAASTQVCLSDAALNLFENDLSYLHTTSMEEFVQRSNKLFKESQHLENPLGKAGASEVSSSIWKSGASDVPMCRPGATSSKANSSTTEEASDSFTKVCDSTNKSLQKGVDLETPALSSTTKEPEYDKYDARVLDVPQKSCKSNERSSRDKKPTSGYRSLKSICFSIKNDKNTATSETNVFSPTTNDEPQQSSPFQSQDDHYLQQQLQNQGNDQVNLQDSTNGKVIHPNFAKATVTGQANVDGHQQYLAHQKRSNLGLGSNPQSMQQQGVGGQNSSDRQRETDRRTQSNLVQPQQAYNFINPQQLQQSPHVHQNIQQQVHQEQLQQIEQQQLLQIQQQQQIHHQQLQQIQRKQMPQNQQGVKSLNYGAGLSVRKIGYITPPPPPPVLSKIPALSCAGSDYYSNYNRTASADTLLTPAVTTEATLAPATLEPATLEPATLAPATPALASPAPSASPATPAPSASPATQAPSASAVPALAASAAPALAASALAASAVPALAASAAPALAASAAPALAAPALAASALAASAAPALAASAAPVLAAISASSSEPASSSSSTTAGVESRTVTVACIQPNIDFASTIRNTDSNNIDVEEIYTLLESLAPSVTLLAGALTAMIAVARQRGSNTLNALKLFVEPEIIEMVEMCLMSFRDLMLAATPEKRQVFEKAVRLGQLLLEHAKIKIQDASSKIH